MKREEDLANDVSRMSIGNSSQDRDDLKKSNYGDMVTPNPMMMSSMAPVVVSQEPQISMMQYHG